VPVSEPSPADPEITSHRAAVRLSRAAAAQIGLLARQASATLGGPSGQPFFYIMSAVTPRVTPSVFSIIEFEAKCWWAHKGRNTIVISMRYAFDGTGFDPSGTAKTQKIAPSIWPVGIGAAVTLPSRTGTGDHSSQAVSAFVNASHRNASGVFYPPRAFAPPPPCHYAEAPTSIPRLPLGSLRRV
jgi:hypothetical protein